MEASCDRHGKGWSEGVSRHLVEVGAMAASAQGLTFEAGSCEGGQSTILRE